MLKVKIDSVEVSVLWEKNESVEALRTIACKAPVNISTKMYGGFEQVGELGTALPHSDTEITSAPGDILLYCGSMIVLFYGKNTWSYTRLGRITGKTPEELKGLLGKEHVTVSITSENTEK